MRNVGACAGGRDLNKDYMCDGGGGGGRRQVSNALIGMYSSGG